MDIFRSEHAKIFRNKYVKKFVAFWYCSLYIIYQYFYGIYIRFKREKNRPRVFCIGYPKTATSSLDEALSILGYRNAHWLRAAMMPRGGWVEYIRKSPFDAFSDSPMDRIGLFKELDKAFPGSKFILTFRDNESLLRSWNYYMSVSPWSFDGEEGNKRLIKMYEEHLKSVKEYFKDRPNDFMVLDIFGGDGWDKLCKFLNKPIPNVDFPKKRVSKYKGKK